MLEWAGYVTNNATARGVGGKARGLTGAVVVEEGIQARAADQHVVRVQDPQAPRLGAITALSGARGAEVWVVEGRVGGERRWSYWVWLVVTVAGGTG